MPKTKDTQIFHKIKKTINLLSLGRPQNKDISSDSLAVINTPALLGKRDALYEKAICSLKREIASLEPGARSARYEETLFSLVSGIETGRQIFFGDGFKNKEKHLDSPLDHYMLLLADTVQTALTLCNHQIIFKLEKAAISDFIGRKAVEQMKDEDTAFAESESKVFDCAKRLVEKAEASIKNHQELLKKSMSKEDETRYKKAFIQFLGQPQQ